MPSHSAVISGGTAAYIAILLLPLLAHYGINLSIEQQAAFTGLVTASVSYVPTFLAWMFPGRPPLIPPQVAEGDKPNA